MNPNRWLRLNYCKEPSKSLCKHPCISINVKYAENADLWQINNLPGVSTEYIFFNWKRFPISVIKNSEPVPIISQLPKYPCYLLYQRQFKSFSTYQLRQKTFRSAGALRIHFPPRRN